MANGLATLAFVITIAVKQGLAITCYDCYEYGYFDGEFGETSVQNCFDPPPFYNNTCSFGSYCYTEFVFEDGLPYKVERNCRSGISEVGVRCEVDYGDWWYDYVEKTTCTYTCDTDNCNKIGTNYMKPCATDCGFKGYCDYILGRCVCNFGYFGDSCENHVNDTVEDGTFRKCVQCNSETDLNCNTTTVTAECESGERCYSAQTWTLDNSKSIRRNIITRGCTDEDVQVDNCEFSEIGDSSTFSNSYYEYTCFSVCDVDGCNTNNPDGVINHHHEKPVISCVQCSGDFNKGENPQYCGDSYSRSKCSSSDTYCYSKVKYWISHGSESDFASEPSDYHLVSVERGCGKEKLPTICSSSKVHHLSFEEVECQESCTEDGCNVGWPARPKCYDYSMDLDDCSYPYQGYCTISEFGKDKDGNFPGDLYPEDVTRGCSYRNVGSGCESFKLRDKTLYQCNYTCTTDGCNVGGSATTLTTSIFVFSLAILEILIQFY